jgi:hypothetical protein
MNINTPAIFGVISGVCLASIQFRRIIKGELPLFGPKAFSAASKIELDPYDRIMIFVAGCSFIICILLLLVVLW